MHYDLWADDTSTNGNSTLFWGCEGSESVKNELSCFQYGKNEYLAMSNLNIVIFVKTFVQFFNLISTFIITE